MAEREPASISVFERIQNTTGESLPLKILVFMAIVAGLWAAQVLLIPIVFAVLVSIGLEPFHRRLVDLHVPRGLSAGFLLTGLVAVLVVGAWSLQAQATTFLNRLPTLTRELRESMFDRSGPLTRTVQPVQQAANELKKAADGPTGAPPKSVVQVEQSELRISDLLWRGTVGAAAFVGEVTVVLFLAYYLLSSGDRYKAKVVALAGPAPRRRREAVDVLNRITEQVERFLIARAMLSVFVATATTVLLMYLRFEQPIIWGLLAGLLSNIPYVGPIASVCAIALTGIAQFSAIEEGVVAGAASSAIVLFEGYVLAPWLLGRAGKMNTGAVFLSLMFWGWIWGVWGMLFAVPIMMAVKTISEHVESLAPVNELLGE